MRGEGLGSWRLPGRAPRRGGVDDAVEDGEGAAAARGVVVSAERSGELRWSATCGKQTGKKEGLEDVPRHGEEDRA